MVHRLAHQGVGRGSFGPELDRNEHLQLLGDDQQVFQNRLMVDDGRSCLQDFDQVYHVRGGEVRTDEVEADVDEPGAVAAQVENFPQHP